MAAALGAANASAADLYSKVPLKEWKLQPAVDGLNAKLEAIGGSIANKAVFGSQGAVSIPVGNAFGLQIDGAAGSFGGQAFAATGVHGFWRDPSRGLVGIYASYTNWDRFGGLHVGRVGGEAAAYLGRWTIEGVAGVESGNSQTVAVGGVNQTFNIKTRFFDRAEVA